MNPAMAQQYAQLNDEKISLMKTVYDIMKIEGEI